jgi:hypothetical protein
VGDTNWYLKVKNSAMRATMKLAINLVCETKGESTDALSPLLNAVHDFYSEFPKEKLSDFNFCLIDGFYTNLKAVVCSEKQRLFQESTRKIIYGLFECDVKIGGTLCIFLERALTVVFDLMDKKCGFDEREEDIESLTTALTKVSDEVFKDTQECCSHEKRIRKRQYDLLNMVKLIKHIVCKESNVVVFGQIFFAKLNYKFSGEYDDFLLDLLMRVAASASCCLTSFVEYLEIR